MRIRIIEKASGVERIEQDAAKVGAKRPSVFVVKVSPEKVATYQRDGNDLILILRGGQRVVIAGFFVKHLPIAPADDSVKAHDSASVQENDPADYRNDLVLEDDNGVYWWGQYPTEWSAFHFTEIETLGVVVGAAPAIGLAPILLGVATVGGVTALVSGGGAAPNNPPVATDDTSSGDEDGGPVTGNVLGNDRDSDGDKLNVTTFTVAGGTATYNVGSAATIPGVGTFTLNADGTYTFTPVANWHGTVPTVTYTVSDGKDGTDTATLIVTINPRIDLAANDDSAGTDEDTPVSGTVGANDSTASGGTLTFSKVSDPGHGTVVVNSDGTYTYTPNDGFSGQDSFTYSVNDPVSGESLTRTVSITVDPAPDLPTLRPDRAATPEDAPVSGNVLTNDTVAHGGPLRVTQFTVGGQTYTAGTTATIPGVGTIVIGPDGAYTFTPVPDWNGTVPTITYTATDGTAPGTQTSTLDIAVTPVADITPDVQKVEGNQPIITPVLNNDTFENSDAKITGTTNGAHGTVAVNPDGTITYTPDPEYQGLDTYTYTVTSGGVTETTTVSINVTHTLATPQPDRATIPEDTPVSGNVLTNDKVQGGRPLEVTQFTIGGQTYTADTTATISGVGTIVIGPDGAYTFTPVPDWNGTVPTITYTATDGTASGTLTSTLDIAVTPVADITSDIDTVHAGQSVTTPVLNNDTFENGNAKITGTTSPGHGTVVVNPDGTITYKPVAGYVGPDTYTYTVISGGVTETTTVTLNVTNDPLIARPDAVSTPEDTPISGNVLTNDSDVNGDPLRVTQFTIGGQTYTAGTTATIAGIGKIVVGPDGGYTFTPVPDWNGSVPTITYTATDGNNGGLVNGTLGITVTPVVDIKPDTATVHAGQSVTTPVLGNDTFENSNAAVTATTNGAHGTVAVNPDGTITYTPVAGFVGPDTYTYTVTSGGVTETTTVNVTVTNTPPVAKPESETTPEDTPVSGNVLTNDSDPDGDALLVTQFTISGQTYTAGATATIPGIGTIVIGTNGAYTFTPAPNWNGTVPPIAYAVSDGNMGGATTSTLGIVVTPLNDAPTKVGTLPNQTDADADGITSIPTASAFADVDGDTLSYSMSGQPAGLSINATTGVISGTIDNSASQGGTNGVYTVTVTASDGHGGTVDQTFTWTVTNPAPVARDDGNTTDEVTLLSVNAANGVIQSTGDADGEDTDPDGDDLAVTQVNGNAANLGNAIDGSSGGKFTLNGDGSYDFDPDGDFEDLAVGETRTTSVTYTISDGEGGTDTATLEIIVTGVNDAPTKVGTLPNQTDADADGITSIPTASAFADVDGDTLSYSMSGQPAGLSINATTGVISGTIDNSASQGGTNGVYTVTVTASDGHGGTVDQSFTWTVTNPAPVAKDDSGSVDEDGTSLVVTAANGVIKSTGDANGVDTDPDGDDLNVTRFTTEGGALPASNNAGGNVTGSYGTLTLNADGRYTYAVNNNNAAVNALKDDDELEDTFTYEISDGEGGTATATLTITIQGHTDAAPSISAVDANSDAEGHVTVYESGLTNDDPDSHSETATGTIGIDAPDGLASITIGGAGGATLTLAQLQALSPTATVTIDTPLGRLVLTGYTSTSSVGGVSTGGDLAYEYVLEKVASTSPSGPDTITEVIPLSLTDAGGASNTGSLVVGIVDDIPSFRTIEAVTLHENDLANGTSPNPTALVQSGDIGVRTGADLTGFDIKLDATQTAPAGLTTGGQAVTYAVSGDGHTLTASAGGTTVFVLTLVDPTTATPEYKFELFRPLDNDGDSNLSFAIGAKDGDGDTATGSIDVTIIDDVPFGLNESTISLAEGGVTVGTSNGAANLLANELAGDKEGADQGLKITKIAYTDESGAPATADVPQGGSVVVDTRYGSLTVHSDGTWSYTSDQTENNASGVPDSFSYTMEDGDGSSSTATQPLTITDTSPVPGTVSLSLSEANIPDTGSTAQTTNTTETNLGITKGVDNIADVTFGTATITGLLAQHLKSGGTELTYQVSADGHTLTASAGTTTIFTLTLANATDATGTSQKVVMSLVGNLDHANASGSNSLTIPVSYTISDTDSNVSSSMTLTVVDDLPTAVADTTPVSVVEGGNTVSGSNLLANDNEGADVTTAHVHQVRYTDESGNPQIAVIAAGAGGSTFNTIHGSLTVHQDGTWSYLSDAAVTSGTSVDHVKATNDTSVNDVFSYTIIDGDGDISNWADQTVTVTDTVPTIGTAANTSVDEANLPLGSTPDGPNLTQTGTLAVTKGADGIDTTFAAITDQTGLNALGLTSHGTALVYTLSNSGHTLTATAGGATIFVATINNPTSSAASYTVTLSGVLDHGGLANLALPFAYKVTDGDGDGANSTFQVTVADDRSGGTKSVTTTEDHSTTFNTNADATGTNTAIGSGASAPAHGNATVNPNGTITYAPAGNYSGTDTFTYTTTADDGSNTTTTVTVTVAPVSDAPTITFDSVAITTNEDTAVALGLNLPVLIDVTDQNGATTGDDPERLGLIELTGIPTGAVLHYGSSDYAVPGPAGTITILISDVDHPTGLSAATLTMTRAEYEAMTVLPSPESHANFTVTVKATSFEVDGTGAPVTGVAGASTTASMTVGVLAVTDPVDLTLNDSNAATDPDALADHHTINEGGSLNLNSVLTVSYPNSDGNTTADIDGSELRWFEVSGLPVGFSLNGTTITTVGQTVTINAPNLSTGNSSLPNMTVTPPADFSGDATVTIVLKAQDRDADNAALVTTVEQDSVTLNLHVNPVAGDVTAGNVTTPEDTAVNFLASLHVTDASTSPATGGSELIDKVVFDVPTGWLVTPPAGSGFTAGLSGSTYTIDFTTGSLTETQREAVLDAFTILPSAHSSKDQTIAVTATTTDTASVNGANVTNTANTVLNVTVAVTPIAERVDADTATPSGNDVTMAGSHTYSGTATEDSWFDLGSINDGYNLASGWFDEDSDEVLYAQLTPVLTGGAPGDTIIGAQFEYGSTTVTYTGTPLNIPVSELGGLKFKPPANVSGGTITIAMQAYTVDTDPDTGATVNTVSGSATLTLPTFAPVADDVALALSARVIGLEDTANPLHIRPTSSDPTETFNVTISNIPDGATLVYQGATLVVSGGRVTIANFDPNAPLTLQPPANSNDDFDLTVSAVSVDGASQSGSISLPIHVDVKGVPDPVNLTTQVANYMEADLDDESDEVMLSDMVTSAVRLDNDGSETMTFRISGLAEGMVLRGGSLLVSGTGEERVWLLTEAQLATATIRVPANYSGTDALTISPVTTENDGASTTWMTQSIQFTVAPSPEATASISANVVEDTISKINLQIVHQNDDTDEVLTTVWIPVSQADSPNFDLYLGAKKLDDVSLGLGTMSIGGVDYYVIPQDKIANLGAKGSSNLDGSLGSFDYKYEITDDHFGTAPSGPPTTAIRDGSFALLAEPVTDAVNANIASITGAGTISDGNTGDDNASDTVVMTSAGQVTVNLNIAKLPDIASDLGAADADGSEEVIRIVISGVPGGVTVVDGELIGGGTWLIVSGSGAKPINSAGGIPEAITFDVSGATSTADTGDTITIEVQTRDRPDDPTFTSAMVADTVSWKLTTQFTGGGGSDPAVINEWLYNGQDVTEDATFALSDIIEAAVTVQTPTSRNTFTITIKEVPPGTMIEGMTQTVVDGVVLWSKSVVVEPGDDANAAIATMMAGILITPPENSNENNAPGGFQLDATLSASVIGGDTEAAEIDNQVVPVNPVTDPPDITIAAPAVDEGQAFMPVSITVADPADGAAATIVDGKLYVKADAAGSTAGLEMGEMTDSNGTPLATEVIGGVTYFVITGVSPGETVDLRYYPDVSTAGDISFTARATTLETGATNQATASTTTPFEFLLVNNGVTITTTPSSGNEDTQIPVTGITAALRDDDGSEAVLAILLSNLPEGFLVFTGSDAASATQASNAGGSGGTNTWVIAPNGTVPAYVAVVPPAYWSGTLDDLKLITVSGEVGLEDKLLEIFDLSDITVMPVSNGLTMEPSPTFGKENTIIPLNLNASMIDAANASVPGADDANVETTTLKLNGLGAFASFYVGSMQITSGITYDAGNNTYTLTGLSQNDLANLGFKQAKSALTDADGGTSGLQIGIEASTVDGAAAASASVTDTVTVAMTAQVATPDADHLLWTGSAINGGAGTDTVELRHLESLSGDSLASLLANFEQLEMHGNTISHLDPADVLAIAGSGPHVLTIEGAAGNAVELSSASEWSTTGVVTGGFVTYTSIPTGSTLLINQLISVSYDL